MVKVALVQIASPADEPQGHRVRRVARMLGGLRQADVVCLPELWAVGYFNFANYETGAETLEGATVEMARSVATRIHSYVHLGSILERGDTGALYNTAVLVDPGGNVCHTYRKIHLLSYGSREAELLTAGGSVAGVQTPFGVVGTLICYDLRFPEVWRSMLDVGASVVFVPAAWPAARAEHWRLLTRARAVEEQCVVLGSAAVGRQGDGVALSGGSCVVDPWGSYLYEGGDEEGFGICEVELAVVADARATFDVLHGRNAPYRTERAPLASGPSRL